MSKIFLALSLALSLGSAACSPATTTPTGCVATTPDAGTLGAICAVAWSCNSDTEHYQILCDPQGSNWACICSTDTNNGAPVPRVVNAFVCKVDAGALPAASQCGWSLSL